MNMKCVSTNVMAEEAKRENTVLSQEARKRKSHQQDRTQVTTGPT